MVVIVIFANKSFWLIAVIKRNDNFCWTVLFDASIELCPNETTFCLFTWILFWQRYEMNEFVSVWMRRKSQVLFSKSVEKIKINYFWTGSVDFASRFLEERSKLFTDYIKVIFYFLHTNTTPFSIVMSNHRALESSLKYIHWTLWTSHDWRSFTNKNLGFYKDTNSWKKSIHGNILSFEVISILRLLEFVWEEVEVTSSYPKKWSIQTEVLFPSQIIIGNGHFTFCKMQQNNLHWCVNSKFQGLFSKNWKRIEKTRKCFWRSKLGREKAMWGKCCHSF